MVEKNYVTKCITIRKDQEDFVSSQRKIFKLSKFVQGQLDNYKKDLQKFRGENETEA